MTEFLVIFVAITNDFRFVITPIDALSCPSYEQAREWFINAYPIEQIQNWTYKCWDRGSNV